MPEWLEDHARRRGDHVAIRFLQRGEAVTAQASYAELAAAVAAMAGGLFRAGLAGAPVVLALPPGLDLIIALLACLRAGAIAVPVPFPATGDEARQRLASVIADLGSGAILAAPDAAIDAGRLRRIDPAALDAAPVAVPLPHPDMPAVIQYSSGSTQTPRGIVVSHANLVANEAMIAEVFGSGPEIVAVNWLPPHHDMGLFGAILHPLFLGGTAVLMPPFAFIQKPLRWLEAIARHGGTIAGAPNFGYELCLRRVTPERAAALDLSSLGVAFCGAEPIRAESLHRFAAYFAAAGFDAAALVPCYGLAEATLLATSTRKGTGLREIVRDGEPDGRRHVACGTAPTGSRVTIRDLDDGTPLAPGEAGEVCIEGPHVAMGLWHGATATVVPLPELDGDGQERWLRTGDIGALTADGLVVLDRIKDVVIVYGRNIYAADAEAAALDAGGPVLAAAAAVALSDAGGERLALLCEVARAERRTLDLAALRRQVAEMVATRCGALPTVEFLGFGALPRTTSGKIRRQAARQALAEGLLNLLPVEDEKWASA
nr:AMP-binding protein [Ancylobacter sp. Lp-2]